MQLRNRQRGLGMWGWIFVLSVIGFVAMVTMQLVPIYLQEMSIERVVKQTALDPGNSSLPGPDLRKAMKLRWDVEGITTLPVNDVKVEKNALGRVLKYDYEARTELVANISLVVHFQKSFQMKGGGSIE
jgi:hypothetical protein